MNVIYFVTYSNNYACSSNKTGLVTIISNSTISLNRSELSLTVIKLIIVVMEINYFVTFGKWKNKQTQ